MCAGASVRVYALRIVFCTLKILYYFYIYQNSYVFSQIIDHNVCVCVCVCMCVCVCVCVEL